MRRGIRGTDYEEWYIDGVDSNHKIIFGFDTLLAVQEDRHLCKALVSVDPEYKIDISSDDLRKFMVKRIEEIFPWLDNLELHVNTRDHYIAWIVGSSSRVIYI